ncbi:MAG TPA: hypothetical protein VLM78_02880, partial [Anaerolineales bacterium]|nr:hypothetical protein [Anaerolineales bacterium]
RKNVQGFGDQAPDTCMMSKLFLGKSPRLELLRKTSHEFTLRARCHEGHEFFRLGFVKFVLFMAKKCQLRFRRRLSFPGSCNNFQKRANTTYTGQVGFVATLCIKAFFPASLPPSAGWLWVFLLPSIILTQLAVKPVKTQRYPIQE